jgi:electron transport complex protein RnfG
MSKKASSTRLIATLAGISVFSGVLLALTYEITKPMIAKNESQALEAAVFDVLPGAVARENYVIEDDGLRMIDGGSNEEADVYAGLDANGDLVGFALLGEARGYADVIRILYGYDPQKKQIVGLQVLSSNETPGLGDKIEKDSEFQKNFEALDASLEHDIVTVKSGAKTEPWQIDGISGATVSSKAIGKALRTSTQKWLPALEASL